MGTYASFVSRSPVQEVRFPKNYRLSVSASQSKGLPIPRRGTRPWDVRCSGGAGSAEAFLTRTGCPIRKAFRTFS